MVSFKHHTRKASNNRVTPHTISKVKPTLNTTTKKKRSVRTKNRIITRHNKKTQRKSKIKTKSKLRRQKGGVAVTPLPINKDSVAAQRWSLDNPRLADTRIKEDGEMVKAAANKAVGAIKDKGAEIISSGVKNGLNTVGVNVSDPGEAQSQLNAFGELMSTDENRDKFVQIGKDIGKIGVEVATELLPLATPLIDESINVAEKGAHKAIVSALNTGQFALTSVLGPFAGVPLALASAANAGISVTDTASKLVTEASDTVNAAIDISNKIVDEQKKVVDRITATVSEFSDVQAPSGRPRHGGGDRGRHNNATTRKSCLKSSNYTRKNRVTFNKLAEYNSVDI